MWKNLALCLVGIGVFGVHSAIEAMSARDILEEVTKRNFTESFRIALDVKTSRAGKRLAKHSMWLIGKKTEDGGAFFLDFEEPEESKGIRVLFILENEKDPRAYMYLPATGKTLPLAMGDDSVDIAGTGLTTDDLQSILPTKNASETIEREEKVEGKDCYVIKITRQNSAGHQMMWISKKDFVVTKAQSVDAKGKVIRKMRVIKFFRTEKGKQFPREEEIVIPQRKSRILVRQDNAVFGIEVPEELTDPKTFGKFKWKL